MRKNNNPIHSAFSNKESINALSWTEKLVSETGTRLTGTAGCKKASALISKKLKEVCHTVEHQDFIHHRDAFLSFIKLMSISYIIAFFGLFFGGVGNYLRLLLWYLYPFLLFLNLCFFVPKSSFSTFFFTFFP